MDVVTIAFHPFTVARAPLARQSFDDNRAYFLCLSRFNRQLHLIPGLIDQQFLWRTSPTYALSVNSQHSIADSHIQARSQQRRSSIAIRRIAFNNTCNTIPILLGVIGPVNAQEPLLVVRSLAVLATKLIGMRSPQFTLEFPEEIRQLRTGRHALDQRSILFVHSFPIHPRHIFHPELLAL